MIETLVALAILGILASLAYSSLGDYVIRTNRSAAKSLLLQVADRQEQFFADNKRYASDLTNLGYAANGFSIDNKGAPVPDTDSKRLYSVSLTNTSATTFTATAAPQLYQAAEDTDCQTLTLAHTGLRGQTGAGPRCW